MLGHLVGCQLLATERSNVGFAERCIRRAYYEQLDSLPGVLVGYADASAFQNARACSGDRFNFVWNTLKPDTTTMSFLRSTIFRNPRSSKVPISPVRK